MLSAEKGHKAYMADVASVKPRNACPEALSKHVEISKKLSENILSTLKCKSTMHINRPVFFSAIKSEGLYARMTLLCHKTDLWYFLSLSLRL